MLGESGFPVCAYDTMFEVAARRGHDPSVRDEFLGAWNAVLYRYHTCYDASASFTKSISTLGVSPDFQATCQQERDLFVFFVSGESVLESLCYALWSWGSISNPQTFPFSSPKHKRKVSPEATSEALGSCSPAPAIAASLGRAVQSREFSEWKEARNTLIHRSAPGRRVSSSVSVGLRIDFAGVGVDFANAKETAIWKHGDIPIDATTTASRLDWLEQQLQILIPDCLEFVRNA